MSTACRHLQANQYTERGIEYVVCRDCNVTLAPIGDLDQVLAQRHGHSSAVLPDGNQFTRAELDTLLRFAREARESLGILTILLDHACRAAEIAEDKPWTLRIEAEALLAELRAHNSGSMPNAARWMARTEALLDRLAGWPVPGGHSA